MEEAQSRGIIPHSSDALFTSIIIPTIGIVIGIVISIDVFIAISYGTVSFPYSAPSDRDTSKSAPLSLGVNVVDLPFSICSKRMLVGLDSARTGGTHP